MKTRERGLLRYLEMLLLDLERDFEGIEFLERRNSVKIWILLNDDFKRYEDL